MAKKLVIGAGQAPYLRMVVRDTLTGNYLSNADVRATLYDAANNQVTGQMWPLVLVYQADSNGVYLGQLENDVGMVVGQTYYANFLVAVPNQYPRTFREEIYVAAPDVDVLPSSDPGSPAFQGPSLQTLLNEAQTAYHRLMLGGQATVVVEQNGERVEFASNNRAALAAYIFSLQQQIKIANGESAGGPMKPYFTSA